MREKWSLEEAVVLLEYYFESRGEYKDSELQNIRSMFIKRAKAFEICYDEKFRNITGLRMQLGCIDYVVSGGAKIFYDAYDLFIRNRSHYYLILSDFYRKYSC